MNNASTTARTAHWSQVERDLIELGATNGIGWAVREMNKVVPDGESPAGWKWVGRVHLSFGAARSTMMEMPPDATKDRQVYEVLAERVSA